MRNTDKAATAAPTVHVFDHHSYLAYVFFRSLLLFVEILQLMLNATVEVVLSHFLKRRRWRVVQAPEKVELSEQPSLVR
ncbi:MAG: hypothetical protein WAN14_09770 [Candidatus Acidiferrales bacterium]